MVLPGNSCHLIYKITETFDNFILYLSSNMLSIVSTHSCGLHCCVPESSQLCCRANFHRLRQHTLLFVAYSTLDCFQFCFSYLNNGHIIMGSIISTFLYSVHNPWLTFWGFPLKLSVFPYGTSNLFYKALFMSLPHPFTIKQFFQIFYVQFPWYLIRSRWCV